MAKLILDIEPTVIKNAEQYANETHTDLSVLVEAFLKNIATDADKINSTINNVKNIEIADWVKKLTLSKTPTPDFDHKHLEGKYGL